MSPILINTGYLITAVCFILALKLMNHPLKARKGNWLSMLGMAIALAVTFGNPEVKPATLGIILVTIGIGAVIGVWSGKKVQMTAMPQMVALLNGLGGGAVALVALFEFIEAMGAGGFTAQAGGDVTAAYVKSVTIVLSCIIGSISFSGSLIAFGKLQELLPGRPLVFPGQQAFNGLLVLAIFVVSLMILFFGSATLPFFLILLACALVLGVTFTMPIGGADMPVVISLLNSFTGCAACLAGFVLLNAALLIGGALVGASGLILTLLMCTAMNRSLGNVLFGAVGAAVSGSGQKAFAGKQPKSYDAVSAANVMANANVVVIVPGYGMAVAQAQHQVKEMADKLNAMGVEVKYAVHPVAGRMPGHMNVLLAEADVPYEQLCELEEINPFMGETDVALVIGANDVVNPAARYDKSSPIYGMPIIDVDKAKTCLVSKRSMGAGFAGVDNELFVADNTYMVFGNAKNTIAQISAALDNC